LEKDEVDETLDTRSDQPLQSFAGRLTRRTGGMFAGQHFTGQHPVAVTKRQRL